MESATHFGERFVVRELRRPLRQPLVDALQNFAYFLDEYFENVVVNVGRRIRFLQHGRLTPWRLGRWRLRPGAVARGGTWGGDA